MNGATEKDAARLSYNIAVANEVLGNIAEAKSWASRSYVDYGNKKAKNYLYMIENRLRDEELSDQQMK
jgi:hypothetical protein